MLDGGKYLKRRPETAPTDQSKESTRQQRSERMGAPRCGAAAPPRHRGRRSQGARPSRARPKTSYYQVPRARHASTRHADAPATGH